MIFSIVYLLAQCLLGCQQNLTQGWVTCPRPSALALVRHRYPFMINVALNTGYQDARSAMVGAQN